MGILWGDVGLSVRLALGLMLELECIERLVLIGEQVWTAEVPDSGGLGASAASGLVGRAGWELSLHKSGRQKEEPGAV